MYDLGLQVQTSILFQLDQELFAYAEKKNSDLWNLDLGNIKDNYISTFPWIYYVFDPGFQIQILI